MNPCSSHHLDNTTVMELEPQNETAEQFYPVIQERIQLGKDELS